jgi:hypothetical protein
VAIDTIAGLKAKMPIGQVRGTSIQDLHDFIDTVEDLTTQQILTKTAQYAVTEADNRRTIVVNSPSSVTIFLPSTLPVGFQLMVAQVGTGSAAFSVIGGNLRSRDNHVRTAGQYAVAYLCCYSNVGSAPQVLLTGDTSV